MRPLILLLGCVSLARGWFGVEHRFVDEQLLKLGSLGLPSTGIIVAFGDYNADQLLDLVLLSADQRSLSFYLWDRSSFKFIESSNSRITTPSDFIITNVAPGDYNYDGRLDLLLMGSKNPNSWWGSDAHLDMRIHLQQSNGTFSPPVAVNSSTMPQPIPFDAKGDMRTHLLGYTPTSSAPVLWENSWEASNHTTMFDLADPPVDLSTFDCKFPNPHSNAFIDLDGDCLADLFLVCQNGSSGDDLSFQIWINNKRGGFKLGMKGALPTGTKTVGFADMDRDGTMDMVLTYCGISDECSLGIAYNVQVPLCSSSPRESTGPCRDPEALCVADPNFQFNLSPASENFDFTAIPISTLIPHAKLITTSTAFRGILPVAPAIGDFNIDGYPDLLILTASSGSRNVNLLESRPCDRTACSHGEVLKGRRALRLVTVGADVLTSISDAESAHWIDIDDDGSLDIVVQRTGNSGAARQIVFIKNNYFHDAFFLKALVLNGACNGWCEPLAEGESRYRTYGVSYSGASYKFTVLDPTGARKATQVGQLPQTGYVALGTPYSYFGLGRTNNYVENLFVGSTRHQEEHFINVEGLIPNSQVVIVPYQYAGSTSPSDWSRELYLHPGDWIPWVTIVLGGAIALLGMVVMVLHLHEKREDETERRARLIQLNFSAL